MKKPDVTLHATVIRVKKTKGDWRCVLAQLDPDAPVPENLPIPRDKSFEIVGELGVLDKKDSAIFVGWWREGAYGTQFSAKIVVREVAASDADLLAYLLRSGLDRSFAGRLIRTLGREKVLDCLRTGQVDSFCAFDRPDHITRDFLELLSENFKREDGLCRAWKLLATLDLDTDQKAAVLRDEGWGPDTVFRFKKNPWDLRFVSGISFERADQAALSSGLKMDDPRRLRAGATAAIVGVESGHRGGHTWASRDEIVAGKDLPLTAAHLEKGLNLCLESGEVVCHFQEPVVKYQRAIVADREEFIAKHLMYRVKNRATSLSPTQISECVKAASLSDDQKRALLGAACFGVFVLTGGPGTGKTHTLREILMMQRSNARRVKLCSPTGKAAVRMAQMTGHPASTIHSALAAGEFSGFGGLSEYDTVIVDEASMLSVELAMRLLNAMRSDAQLILVGDVDQLAPVDCGAVLRDIIASGKIAVSRLEEIFRQAGSGPGSSIPHVARAINLGDVEAFNASLGQDVFFTERADIVSTGLGAWKAVETLISKPGPTRRQFRADEVQVITPQKNTDAGTEALNRRLSQMLCPLSESAPTVRIGSGDRIGIGTRVIQVANDWDRGVANGELGRVLSVDPNAKDTKAVVDFGDRTICYKQTDLSGLRLGYAITAHKAQGSEFPATVVVVAKAHSFMLDRSWIYTAVTRTQEFCGMVGQRETLEKYVAKDPLSRYTTLKERIEKYGREEIPNA